MAKLEEIVIPQRCAEILADNHLVTMNVFRRKDGGISSTPVGYVGDGERVRISTIKSRMKYKNLLADPRITLCVISRHDMTEYVEIQGYATIAEDPDRSFFKLQFKEGQRIINGADVEPSDDLDSPDAERVIITIHPQRVSSPVLYGGRLKH